MANAFVNRYVEMTGLPAKKILNVKLPDSLRINTLKSDTDTLLERLRNKKVKLEKIPFLNHGYAYNARFSLGATEEYLLGYYYLQEAASQLPVQALMQHLDVTDKTKVLDMAAAPGSKTTQLSAAMKNQGTIVALDSARRRAEALGNNLERCGCTNVAVYQKDARHASDLKLEYDAILLDAPCSGNFTQEKGWLEKRRLKDLQKTSKLQKRLLAEALDVLKPGGLLVYSTCSLEPEENEAVVTEALGDRGHVIATDIIGSPGMMSFAGQEYRKDLEQARRLWPHETGTQGFFIAVIRKAKKGPKAGENE